MTVKFSTVEVPAPTTEDATALAEQITRALFDPNRKGTYDKYGIGSWEESVPAGIAATLRTSGVAGSPKMTRSVLHQLSAVAAALEARVLD